MSPRSDRARRAFTVATVAAALASLLPALAAAQAQASAQEPRLALLPEDDELDEIVGSLDRQDPLHAERVLRDLAERGSTPAMERLAMMHWQGAVLYGPGPWQRAEALRWWRLAADNGSELARMMLSPPSTQPARAALARP